MESVPSSPGEGEGVWRVYHHYLVRGRECGECTSLPGEGEGVWRVYHHHLVRGRECGECTIITW